MCYSLTYMVLSFSAYMCKLFYVTVVVVVEIPKFQVTRRKIVNGILELFAIVMCICQHFTASLKIETNDRTNAYPHKHTHFPKTLRLIMRVLMVLLPCVRVWIFIFFSENLVLAARHSTTKKKKQPPKKNKL